MSHQLRMPNRFESRAICTLNRPSEKIAMPSAAKMKSRAPSGFSRITAPRAMSRMPNARSYWKARRNRSPEK